MNTGNPRPPGAPMSSRRGQEYGTCTSRGLFPLSRVFPLSAASRFSSKARLFASAATAGGSSTSDQEGSSECRSRVKVWEATSGGAPEHTVNNSCPATAIPEYEGVAGALSRAQIGQHIRACEVEWSRQFLGHSVNAVLFAPTPQRTKPGLRSASAVHGNDPVGGGSHEKSGDNGDSTVLLIGTDKGMVAAANVSGGGGSKLLYAVYLKATPREEERGSDGNLACLGTSNSAAGRHTSNAAVTPMAAAAAMGTTSFFAVHDLRALPGRSDAVVALVGCVEGSTIYLLNVEDGSILQEDALSKCYTLMATPSRLLPPASNANVEGALFHTQLRQLALLGCGSARKMDGETQLDQSPRSGVLFLFDVPQRKQWLKLTGASSDSCCSLALQDNLEFAAACFSSSLRQQQTQLLVWKLPNRATRSSEKGAAAKRKKLPPAMMSHFFEGLVQLLLPVTKFKSEAEKALTSNEMVAGSGHKRDTKYPEQLLVGLSRSSIIAIWGCFSIVSADSQATSYTLELLLQVDSATPTCSISSGKGFSAPSGLVAAGAAPGVWYIEEAMGFGWWGECTALSYCDAQAEETDKAWEAEPRRSLDQSTACTQQELILRVVRGSYAAPVITCVAIPSFADGSVLPKDQLLYLPLLLSRSGKLSCGNDGVIRPLSARRLKQTKRKGSEQREDAAGRECSGNQEDQCVIDADHELPTASLKRKIGAECSREGQTVSEVSSSKEGQTKIRKASGFSGKEKTGGAGTGKSNVASILRQALVASDARLLEFVLSSTTKDKKELAAAVASLTPARALLLLQHLVQQQQTSPATSILKGPWIEELVKQHGVVLGSTEAGREQLVLLLLQVEERRRTEAALVKVKGRVELLLQQMQRIQKLKAQRRKDEVEAREPLVVHREQTRS